MCISLNLFDSQLVNKVYEYQVLIKYLTFQRTARIKKHLTAHIFSNWPRRDIWSLHFAAVPPPPNIYITMTQEYDTHGASERRAALKQSGSRSKINIISEEAKQR
jgi:hypothetical protein